ncbi:MAG: glycoside hydrolase [Paludibacteraceae bacterium]|nr:glycoside hydrolase [Paludibacteraceae bacterium]
MLLLILSIFLNQSLWLQKAEDAKPVLHETQVVPTTLVQLVEDEQAFQGYRMESQEGLENYLSTSMKENPSVIVDLGNHYTGYFSFHLKTLERCIDGPLHIRLSFAEIPSELAADWTHYTGWLSAAWRQVEDMIIFDMDTTFTLSRRYSGRYVKIELLAYSQDFDFCLDQMAFRAVSSAPELSDYPTLSPALERIYKVGLRTLSECMQTVYEDGPKRDKRLWAGDVYLEALANQYSFRNFELTKRCLYLFAALTEEDGRIYGNIFEYPTPHPQLGSHPEDYALLYCVALRDYAEATQDWETARDLFPVVVRQLEYAQQIYGQYEGHWLFFDWREGVEKTAAMECITVFALNQSAQLAEQIGQINYANQWRKKAAEYRKQIRRDYWSRKEKMIIDNGQFNEIEQIWATLSDVITKKEAQQALTTMKHREDVIRLGTPYANHYYVEALIQSGLTDAAREHVLTYWGSMVDKGADTFWEAYDPNDEWLSPYDFAPINSYCHAWSCTPVYFIGKYPELFNQ